MSLQLREINADFGAEVSGINLTQPVNDVLRAELNALFAM